MLCESGTTLVNEDLMMMMDCIIHGISVHPEVCFQSSKKYAKNKKGKIMTRN